MATFDIVGGKNEEIDRISFSFGSFSKDYGKGMILETGPLSGPLSDSQVRITSKQHAEYMISAIEKAIELGWFDDLKPETILSSRSPNATSSN